MSLFGVGEWWITYSINGKVYFLMDVINNTGARVWTPYKDDAVCFANKEEAIEWWDANIAPVGSVAGYDI